jgi:hypothetical protein
LACGLIGLSFTVAFMLHAENVHNAARDPWIAWYVFATTPISLLGVVLGIVGKEPPRAVGLILSACILLRVVGGAIAM